MAGTSNKAGFPMRWHGEAGRLDRLSGQEKLLLSIIFREQNARGNWGVCRLLNEELGAAIGLSGERDKVTRKVRFLLYGRTNRGKRLPGLVEKGLLIVHADEDQRNPSHRTIRLADPTPGTDAPAGRSG